ncbi:single-stranded-DNA-specific exonuclease RecJ [Candidatus Kaiserbacteria bacterium RIFCSPHIGHO2_02_FULL_49_34]|uniref:Single-stranded-DNA-specific exonuclease RecJ n=1 Tax=Candidatus Kaiserbacteria bacterium RIFCSPHIGHO2_02_FULL_49_34 TaxID=1798491 RepID=A0A1F6DLP8_9BACT|nr:MAG: single-stranded-DNA-specific exonuclease RecJ [Candidatus Kaiserbacteria bacterium RIFCSPHIGHO2_02_FULL_49_34]
MKQYTVVERTEERLIDQLLKNRGVSYETKEVFLAPNFERDLHDPFLMTDMHVAVDRVLLARDTQEKVVIFSDYDCDGIPAGTLIHDLFRRVGITNFTNYIPHRHNEGFGLNMDAVNTFIADGVTLVVVLDCGTVSFDEIAHAKAGGIDVIVIDHHETAQGRIPDVIALLNPRRDEAYPWRSLCACGVAFKFAQAFLMKLREQEPDTDIPLGWEKWLLDLVALSTISDMVPLRDENRALVTYGLKVLRKTRRPGILQILRDNKVNPVNITEDDIGFTIGPRINAASRMGIPKIAFTMLSGDEKTGREAAQELENLNKSRKAKVAAMTREVHQKFKHMEEIPPVIVIGNPDWMPSLAGLVANSLSEEYKRPAFVWGRDGKGHIKGSCRSGSTSVVALMEHAKDAILQGGGHHQAGGFEVADDKIHTLGTVLCAAHEALAQESETVSYETIVDATISLHELTNETYTHIAALAPFGMKNSKPLFQIPNITPYSVELFGKTKEHTKLILPSSTHNIPAIAFFRTPDSFHMEPMAGKQCTLIAHFEESFFMNKRELRLRIVDVI